MDAPETKLDSFCSYSVDAETGAAPAASPVGTHEDSLHASESVSVTDINDAASAPILAADSVTDISD